MSTMFTKGAVSEDPPAALPLLLDLARVWVSHGLRSGLDAAGFADVTDAQLSVFANLDCGATSASEVARRMGQSRQGISRTLRDLEAAGLVTLGPSPGNAAQKTVVMTDRGMAFATAARRSLAETEAELARRIGADRMAEFRATLEMAWGAAPVIPDSGKAGD